MPQTSFTMKKLFHAALVLPLVLFAVSCSESNDDGGDKPVKLSPETKPEQQVYADDEQAPTPIRFTATAPWTATVAEVQTKAETDIAAATGRAETSANQAEAGRVDWLTLSAYSGQAGEISLTMNLTVNTTGHDRKAEIRIACGDTTLTVTVEQKGTKQDGTQPNPQPEDPNKPDASNLKYRITKIECEESWGGSDTSTEVYTFAYDDAGRLIKQEVVRKWAPESASGSEKTSVYTKTITYGAGTVSYEYTDYDDGVLDIQEKSTAALDEKGRIVSGESVSVETVAYPDGLKEEEGSTKYEFGYDEEGCLVQSTLIEHYSEEWRHDYSIIWTDGNPTRLLWEYEENDKKENDYTTYGTVPNNANLDLNWLIVLDSEGWVFSVGDEYKTFAAMGYTGKRSKNLAESNREEYSFENGVSTTNYTYQLDGDRVTKITSTRINAYGNSSVSKYTIHYAE